MSRFLGKDKDIPLNFKPGTIITLKPTPSSRAPARYDYSLELYNKKGDTLLKIEFSTSGVVLNDCASRSLKGDGSGQPQTVDITQVDLKGRSVVEATISIHHYLTESKFGRYQILFNGTTIAHFESRFPGPAKEISYWVDFPGPAKENGYWVDTPGPRAWDVDVYQIDDLLPEEQLSLGPER